MYPIYRKGTCRRKDAGERGQRQVDVIREAGPAKLVAATSGAPRGMLDNVTEPREALAPPEPAHGLPDVVSAFHLAKKASTCSLAPVFVDALSAAVTTA